MESGSIEGKIWIEAEESGIFFFCSTSAISLFCCCICTSNSPHEGAIASKKKSGAHKYSGPGISGPSISGPSIQALVFQARRKIVCMSALPFLFRLK